MVPSLAARYFKAGLLYLALGVMTGLHMAMAHHFEMGQMHPYYIPAHTHVLLIGFLLMTLMGAAVWKLPPATSAWSGRLSTLAYWGLSLGTLERYAAETWLGYSLSSTWLRYAVVVGMTIQSLAILCCILAVWPRLRVASGDRQFGGR